MSTLYEADATGDVVARDCMLHSVTLTGGSDAATIVIRDASGTDPVLTLKAAANASVEWRSGAKEGVFFGAAVHATLTGTAPLAYVEVS